MRIKSMDIENFRSIETLSVSFKENTTIIGQNNSGKSAILSAIGYFYQGSSQIQDTDFYKSDLNKTIAITLKFSDLTPEERTTLASNMMGDELIVRREFTRSSEEENGKYYNVRAAYPAFTEIRNTSSKTEKRNKYNALPTELNMPTVRSADQIEQNLASWEEDNPEQLQNQKLSGFRGFTGIANGTLKSKTEFILVPAIEDIVETINGQKNSPVKKLLSTIARQTIENKDEFKLFKEESNLKLKEITNPANIPELQSISEQLTDTLKKYYNETQLEATLSQMGELPISFPSAEIKINDNGFTAGIENVGHGLQRAILFSVIEYMARHKLSSTDNGTEEVPTFDEPQSDIIIAIEEPETFQHPMKQRLFSKALRSLCKSFNTVSGIRLQIISVTHSSLFVDIKELDELRVCRRLSSPPDHKVELGTTTLSDCATITASHINAAPNVDRYKLGLHVFNSEISEGFFAKKVILVEGVSDKALLEGYYKIQKREPLEEGICILSTDGKSKMDKPALIFKQLGIPVFAVFDNDENKTQKKRKTSTNVLLQKILEPTTDPVSYPSLVTSSFASIPNNLENYLVDEVTSDVYDTHRGQIANTFDIGKADCTKSPNVTAALIKGLVHAGNEFPYLDHIIGAVDNMN